MTQLDPAPLGHYYRYEDYLVSAGCDEVGDPIGPGQVAVRLRQCPIAKYTPKGVRLANGRFILASARKRWACPTRDEALISFLARKTSQIRMLSAQIANANRAAQIAQRMFAWQRTTETTSFDVGLL